MTDIVNLRTARKRAGRKQQQSLADANRLAHGRSAVERKREQARREQAERMLNQHRIDTQGDR